MKLLTIFTFVLLASKSATCCSTFVQRLFKECLEDSSCNDPYEYCSSSDNSCTDFSGYQYYGNKYCSGDTITGVDSLEAAIDRCNADSQCGCFFKRGGIYYLNKGTEIWDSIIDSNTWVKQ